MSLEDVVKDFNKRFHSDVIGKGKVFRKIARISFSSPSANYMLYGGIPRGRLIEFAGSEGSGKTTTALDIVANAQKLFKKEYEEELEYLTTIEKPSKSQVEQLQRLQNRGPLQILFVDCENTLDVDWATRLGVDFNNIIVMSPEDQSAEEIFEAIRQMINTGELGLVVLDSLGVMLSAQAYEKSIEEKTYGGISMPLTRFSKEAAMICARTNCTFIGINQMREDMNSPYGGEQTTGGRGWRHNTSVRLMFRRGKFVDEKGNELNNSAENPAGNIVKIAVAKTKVCKPDRRIGYYVLNYTEGIDYLSDMIDIGVKIGAVQQGGSWFTFIDTESGEIYTDDDNNPMKAQGKPKAVTMLKENAELFDILQEQLNKYITAED